MRLARDALVMLRLVCRLLRRLARIPLLLSRRLGLLCGAPKGESVGVGWRMVRTCKLQAYHVALKEVRKKIGWCLYAEDAFAITQPWLTLYSGLQDFLVGGREFWPADPERLDGTCLQPAAESFSFTCLGGLHHVTPASGHVQPPKGTPHHRAVTWPSSVLRVTIPIDHRRCCVCLSLPLTRPQRQQADDQSRMW